MKGCEPHSVNWGGAVLLTRRSNEWHMIWYKAGVPTDECHKVPLRDGREILVCIGKYGAQGNEWTALYVEDLLAPTTTLTAGGEKSEFFQVFDNTLTCGWSSEGDSKSNTIERAYIESVEFYRSNDEGPPSISVTANFGKRRMRSEDIKACIDEQIRRLPKAGSRFFPATARYHIEFVFDGHKYTPTPASAAAALVFAHEIDVH